MATLTNGRVVHSTKIDAELIYYNFGGGAVKAEASQFCRKDMIIRETEEIDGDRRYALIPIREYNQTSFARWSY